MAPCFLPASIAAILQLITFIQESLLSSSESSEESFAFLQDLQHLSKTFKWIQAALKDSEEREIQYETVKLWLSEIREMAYDAEDVLDEFQYEVLRAQVEARSDVGKANDIDEFGDEEQKEKVSVPVINLSFLMKILLESGMKVKIDKIKKRLDEISEDRKKYWFGDEHRKRHSSSAIYSPPPTTYQVRSNVYGRETEKEDVTQFLLSENGSKLVVVAILGIGGIGKTTLAQLVYNDYRVSGYFDIRTWVHVSMDFDVLQIARTIMEEVTGNPCSTKELSQLAKKLCHELKGKKLLLVLDDVWNEWQSPWETLEDLLSDASIVRILLTARNKTVTDVMKTVIPFHLRDLPEKKCWQLFKNYAFDGRDSGNLQHLVAIGKEIVKKCHGLPLAAKSLGSLLRKEEDQDVWNDVLQNEIWDLPPQDEILPALKLSYNRMPTHLKSCFAYCSIIPKGCQLDHDLLVNLWIAQGFIQSKYGRNLEDTARGYIDELLGRSFLEIDPHSSHHMRMHDMIHDLASYVSNGECGAHTGGKLHLSGDSDDHIRHLYMDVLTGCHVVNTRGLRTLISHSFIGGNLGLVWEELQCYGELYDLLPPLYFDKSLVENIIRLRVLEIPSVPTICSSFVVGNLKHLRYLHIGEGRLKDESKEFLDSICHLFNLQTLRLHDLPIEVLPMEFGNLVNLKFLSLRNCTKLEELPHSVRDLTSLHHLDVTGSGIRWLPTSFYGLRSIEVIYSDIEGIQITAVELKDLLRKLKVPVCIGGIKNITEVDDAKKVELKNMHRIEYLQLSWRDLETLSFKLGQPSYLSVKFPNQNVSLKQMTEKAEVVLDNLCPHVHIKELSIDYYPGWQYPKWLSDPSSFAKLTKICLRRCRPYYLPSLGQLPALTHLSIEFSLVRSIGEEFYCFNNNVTRRAAFPMLKEMSIDNCPSLMTWDRMLDGDFPNLEKLNIIACYTLQTLPTIEESVISSNLSGRYPSWISNDSFTMLTDITLDSTSVTRIPTLGELPVLASLSISRCIKIKTIGPWFCWSDSKVERMVAFPELTTLNLSYLSELETWTGVLDGDFPKLAHLVIKCCNKLRMLPIFSPFVKVEKS